MIRTTLTAFAACVALALPASAAQVFFDDFSGDAPGLQKSDLTNFTVTGGVDLVGVVNSYGIVTPGAPVIDLDGSPGPGLIASKGSFAFAAGDNVTLSVLLGGAQRGSTFDGFSFGFNFNPAVSLNAIGTGGHFNFSDPDTYTNVIGIYLDTQPLAGSADFLKTTFSFHALTAGNLGFYFKTDSHDNIGPLMTNVALDISPAAVPLPAGGLLLLGGVGALAALRRKRLS